MPRNTLMASAQPHLVELQDVHKNYQMGDNTVFALRGISLTIEQGDFIAIMGPSGSGKSTLMHVLGLLDVPDSGSYRLRNREVANLTEDELSDLRRKEVGFIFQQFHLLPRMSALENISLPLIYSDQRKDFSRADKLLEQVGLTSRAAHHPNELSGGQQQRVAIARSLIHQPRMILADEPTGNLDSVSEKEILNILCELNSQGITIIVVTHEDEVGRLAKRVIKMRDGEVQSDVRSAPVPSRIPVVEAVLLSGKKTSVLSIGSQIVNHFVQGFKSLVANKVRTVLSMLGILIGVAAVVAMLALGKGAQTAIEKQLSSLGSNLLVLRPGSVRIGGVSQGTGASTRLTPDDAMIIKNQVNAVQEAAPALSGRAQVTSLNKNWSTQVLGVAPAYARMHASVPDIGRFFSDDENLKRSRVVVVGATVVRELFGDSSQQSPIGEWIKINKVNFQIIGILPEKGANSFRDQDDVVVIPVLTAMHRLLGKTYVDSIDIEVKPGANMDLAQDDVNALILARHKVPVSQSRDAFQIRNMADIQAALSESSKTMSLLLASIAAISLLVGGIGIMNIMLVSVTERTREIGLRKAVGARRSDILSQFLVEAVVVSVVGGLCGIVLGWAITTTLSWVSGWATSISLSSILLSFFFSASIGVIFGIYPARKASLLHPIDALRFE